MKKSFIFILLLLFVSMRSFSLEWKSEGVSFLYEAGNPNFVGGMFVFEQQLIDNLTSEEYIKVAKSSYESYQGTNDGFAIGAGLRGIYTIYPSNIFGIRLGFGVDGIVFNGANGKIDITGDVGGLCGVVLLPHSVVSIIADVTPSFRYIGNPSFALPINVGIRLNNASLGI